MQNSFEMLGQYKKQAQRAGISKTRINEVLQQATSGDRENLEAVLFEALSEIEGKTNTL